MDIYKSITKAVCIDSSYINDINLITYGKRSCDLRRSSLEKAVEFALYIDD